jgi:hypothetical protein
VQPTPRWLDWAFRAGILLTVAGAIWLVVPSQEADASYAPQVPFPAYKSRAPRVLIDEAHYNVHTADGRYGPFARLLARDGLWIRRGTTELSAAALVQVDVLVVANALGLTGVVQQMTNVSGLERYVNLGPRAFDASEIAAVDAWVRDGGRLLLVADHAPAGAAAADLARAFGVELRGWWVEDPREGMHDPGTGNPAFLVFSRGNGLLAHHPIVEGRSETERVSVVMTFTGQAVAAPAHAVSLLRLSDSAREYPYRRSRETESRPAAGLAQAVALHHGRGRVVVFGEAAALTAQLARRPDGQAVRFGINRADLDNRQLVLNVVHWLTGLL